MNKEGCLFLFVVVALSLMAVALINGYIVLGIALLVVSAFLIGLMILTSSNKDSGTNDETQRNYSYSNGLNDVSENDESWGLDVPTSPDMLFSVLTEEKYGKVLRYINRLVYFSEEMVENERFVDHAFSVVNVENSSGTESIEEKRKLTFKYMIFSDLCYLFDKMGYDDSVQSPEQLCLHVTLAKILDVGKNREEPYSYDIMREFNPTLLESMRSMRTYCKVTMSPEVLVIAYVAESFDEQLKNRYISHLYKLFSIIAKIDDKVTDKEKSVLSLLVRCMKTASIVKAINAPDDARDYVEDSQDKNEENKISYPLSNPMDELQKLIGLQTVKESVTTLVNFIKIQKERAGKGLKTAPISYHCVFTGNPGTGKTTVARLLAGIYRDLGIVKKGHLVETDRSGLVAEYVGQTAVKTNKVIDRALDGILFIDEAYTLANKAKEDFGPEAIATLLKRMEDDRNRLVVILAGYTDEIKTFIDSNPGLQSRFNNYIEFPDYSDEELLQILKSNLKSSDYEMSEDAEVKACKIIADAHQRRNRKFGNGRYVRNLFEKMVQNQANRLSGISPITEEMLRTIAPDDIEEL
ncbi:MAG: AAA family ATPase [Muribaculaceae bacterium]|nr:AAA family ATPase [Muribaculaceae bacterium]